jgi:hypothetical protein
MSISALQQLYSTDRKAQNSRPFFARIRFLADVMVLRNSPLLQNLITHQYPTAAPSGLEESAAPMIMLFFASI